MYITKLTLIFWVLKCFAELWLCWVSIVRKVKTIWLLGLYTFCTTLGLMVMYRYAEYKTYCSADHWVSVFGMLLMCYIFIQLTFYVIDQELSYFPLLGWFIYLLLLQLICQRLNFTLPYNPWLGRMESVTWTFSILLLTLQCRRFPRPTRVYVSHSSDGADDNPSTSIGVGTR